MADSEENKENKPKSRGATRHCCYGLCKSDSRYKEKDYMFEVTWIPFPKPHRDLEKCKRWVRACGRGNFTHEKVNKWTYICNKHFVEPEGPTKEYPDPIPATFTPQQVTKMCRKRKAPTPRANPVSKKLILEASEALLSLQDVSLPDHRDGILEQQDECTLRSQVVLKTDKAVNTDLLPVLESENKGTQTQFACGDILVSKINRIMMKNAVNACSPDTAEKGPAFEETFSCETVSADEKMFKFYTGLTVLQFNHLFSCLGSEPEDLSFWRGNKATSTISSKRGPERKISAMNQLFMTLIKLRQAFPNQDLAYRFGISVGLVSNIINTWIQYLYKKTEGLRKRQFPSRHMIKRHLPACFASFKNVRVIIDCFEIFVESSKDFVEQGNMYSSYKNHTTLKCLVGISPSGGISFLSDTFEGSISDREIVRKSQLLNYLDPGDLVIADRGFLIRDLLQEHQVELNIPPFLNGRTRLTAQEEILTKRIARVRIHVERAIERMKKFKIIGKRLPLSLKPVVSQIVHVIGFLVNYQEPLVK